LIGQSALESIVMVPYASDSQQADNLVDLLPGFLDQLDRVDFIQMEAPESR
jgi:hypothetical protein